MNIEEEIQRIMQLWEGVREEVETTTFLGYLWEHTRELGELEVRVERLEPKVIKLLETIPTLRRHSPEYRAHCDHLVMLIRNIEPTEEWMRKIHDDLDFMSKKIGEAKEAYIATRIMELKKHQISEQQTIGDMYEIKLFDIESTGGVVTENELGYVRLRDDGKELYVKQIYIKGFIPRSNISDIVRGLRFYDEYEKQIKRWYADRFNVEMKLDFGNEWPKTRRSFLPSKNMEYTLNIFPILTRPLDFYKIKYDGDKNFLYIEGHYKQ